MIALVLARGSAHVSQEPSKGLRATAAGIVTACLSVVYARLLFLAVLAVALGLPVMAQDVSKAPSGNVASPDGPDAFSFTLDGQSSREFLSAWKKDVSTPLPSAGPGRWKPRFADAASSLARAEIVSFTNGHLALTLQREIFSGGNAGAHLLTFTNLSSDRSPVIADVYPLDTVLQFEGDGPITLHYAKGSHNEQTDFQPMETVLERGKPATFAPFGGRSSDGYLPYFNLASSKDGVIIGIGWTGQWKISFEAVDARHVHVTAGMERTHIRLDPNESFRTPGILVLPWSGDDWLAGQNELRRFVLRHFTPKQNGAPLVPPIAASPHGYIGFNDTTETNLRECVERIATHKLPVDTFWLDAGWGLGGFPLGMGNPAPDPARFPNGLKPVSDAAHAHGLKYLQWFEPERVMQGTWIEQNHPEWLLSPAGLPPELVYHEKDGFRLLDLGDEQARDWITKRVSSQIAEYGIDVYRQDFNMCPLYYWRNNEPDDRQGMTEIRYVEGLYNFLDTVRADHPGLVIDNCASGGRRLDFEMMRRSVALWRSDNCWEPIGEQCMTYGLSLWLPLHGVGSISLNPYDFRSGMGSSFTLALDFRSDDPKFWEEAIVRLNELASVREFFSKDFYPLTPYTTADDAWIAWQFHDPKKNAGIVQAFRRGKAKDSVLRVALRGLIPTQTYSIRNLGSLTENSMSGKEFANNGIEIPIEQAPGSALLTYVLAPDPKP